MISQVLVVNGSPIQEKNTRTLLERAGYSVSEVISMETAISWARQNPVAAVVVEASDSADRSFEFARGLRRHPVTSALPIVLLNRDSREEGLSDELPEVSVLFDPCPPRYLLQELAYVTRMADNTVSDRASRPGADIAKPQEEPIQGQIIRSSAVATLDDAYGYSLD
jgi:CheY-like chemotaxis protein